MIKYPKVLDQILSIERGWGRIAELLDTQPSRLVEIVINGTDDFTLTESTKLCSFFNCNLNDLCLINISKEIV